MIPLLLFIDGIIWYGVLRSYKTDISQGDYPENATVDNDLDAAWQTATATAPIITIPVINKLEEKDNDKLIKRNFEAWLKSQTLRDYTLEDYLWKEGILNPEEIIWCEGVPLSACDPDDMKIFEEIKNKAFLEGMYHSKLLEEGGLEDLYKSWFMLKGCSDYGAEILLASGVKPWEFEL